MTRKTKDTLPSGVRYKKWEIVEQKSPISNGIDEIIDTLLTNRGITAEKDKKEFFSPIHPSEIGLSKVGLKNKDAKKIAERLKFAKKNKEKVIVFGDYDADGICATAILWETLFAYGVDVLPFIPDRFTQGYGISAETIDYLSNLYPEMSLIITVDNGIVAHAASEAAKEKGIDLIITDHHQAMDKMPAALCIFHTTTCCGSVIAWFLSRELRKILSISEKKLPFGDALELAAIGTVADQIPLLGINRSIVYHGLKDLNKTTRMGLKELLKIAQYDGKNISTYEINYVIAPRLNAMGRLGNAIDSLRLLCTKNSKNAVEFSKTLNSTNLKRQEVVETVVKSVYTDAESLSDLILVLDGPDYHEGVIGLAASKLVEEFYRPAIVMSRGKTHSKASARSISGFSIIDAIRSQTDLIEGGGGHTMAAGFTILNENIDIFREKINIYAKEKLTADILQKKLKIDVEINFDKITKELFKEIEKFEPFGIGNYKPYFVTKNVEVLEVKPVGKEKKHLKLHLMQNSKNLEAIAFGFGDLIKTIQNEKTVNLVYSLTLNTWNGNTSIQLQVKDIGF